MRISVEISFSFKHELDRAGLVLDLPEDADVEGALRILVRRYPQIKTRLFTSTGEVKRHINALVNGENVRFRRNFDTPLHDGDRLTLLPPVGGG
jgi:MoaD family protein